MQEQRRPQIVEGLQVASIYPGHCTGEPSFAALRKAFGDHYLYAGLGTALDLLDTSQK
jgi:7,8-dihydropterin-6-yl-methyl-4-(beta-D-ribofuranosyl)aminobenzene 5'-phosphate synthase